MVGRTPKHRGAIRTCKEFGRAMLAFRCNARQPSANAQRLPMKNSHREKLKRKGKPRQITRLSLQAIRVRASAPLHTGRNAGGRRARRRSLSIRLMDAFLL